MSKDNSDSVNNISVVDIMNDMNDMNLSNRSFNSMNSQEEVFYDNRSFEDENDNRLQHFLPCREIDCYDSVFIPVHRYSENNINATDKKFFSNDFMNRRDSYSSEESTGDDNSDSEMNRIIYNSNNKNNVNRISNMINTNNFNNRINNTVNNNMNNMNNRNNMNMNNMKSKSIMSIKNIMNNVDTDDMNDRIGINNMNNSRYLNKSISNNNVYSYNNNNYDNCNNNNTKNMCINKYNYEYDNDNNYHYDNNYNNNYNNNYSNYRNNDNDSFSELSTDQSDSSCNQFSTTISIKQKRQRKLKVDKNNKVTKSGSKRSRSRRMTFIKSINYDADKLSSLVKEVKLAQEFVSREIAKYEAEAKKKELAKDMDNEMKYNKKSEAPNHKDLAELEKDFKLLKQRLSFNIIH